MNPIIRFGTDRLQACALTEGDLDDLHSMHQDPRTMATLGGVRTRDRTRQFLERNLAHWEQYGFGLWIFRTEDGSFVGRAGLRHVRIDDQDEVELAYALDFAAWGKGLATEMARAILAIGFCRLQLPHVVAFTLKTNHQSVSVMEKVGCTFERELVHAGLPHVLYRQNRDHFLATNA
jgi:[ribosomal protein S5]-alanine N-acetyltransferase